MDHNAQGRRPHSNRGRRGPDRRGTERRSPQQEPGPRGPAEQVDVEQIMRDIRARIAQRHGIELSTPQIQELAARRLEAILDPRGVNPTLMEQLRRSAAAPSDVAPATPDPGYTFEDTTLFETHRGVLRFVRRLLNPILKLFFNPNPLVHALHTQSRLNREAAARETERERLQAEWNALHYEILQRMVMEVSRVSVEMQALSARVESLSTKVDFNDRRVRSFENTGTPARPPRAMEPAAPSPAAAGDATPAEAAPAGDATTGDSRRRRRRRRGRRSGSAGADAGSAAGAASAAEGSGDLLDADDGDDEERGEAAAGQPPADASQVATVASEPPLPAAGAQPSSSADATAPAHAIAAPPPEPAPHAAAAAFGPTDDAAAAPRPVTPQPAPPPDEPAPQSPPDTDPGPPDR